MITKEEWLTFLEQAKFVTTMNNIYSDEKTLDFNVDISELEDKYLNELEAFPDENIKTLQTALEERFPHKKRVNIIFRHFIIPLKPMRVKVHQIRAADINKLLYFDGLVRTSTDVLPRVEIGIFTTKCCGNPIAQKQTGDEIVFVKDTCPQCGEDCEEGDVDFREDLSIKEDYQIVNMEEEPEGMKGRQPEKIECQLHGPFTKEGMRVGAGERVSVVGVYRTRRKGKKTVFEKYIEVFGVEAKGKNYEDFDISDEDEVKFTEMSKNPTIMRDMSNGIAPNIKGLDIEKDAVMLQLFGGNLFSPEKRRGDIHLALVGDPSTGKSQIARAITEIAPHCIRASGAPTTTVGLTAAAIQNPQGGFILEAGAAVLCDRGLLIIDEFDKMNDATRGALHEIMEDQICYDDQTEILTENGWMLFKHLNKDEKVATLNRDGYLEYQQPIKYIDNLYNGKMFNIKNRQVNLSITENHNIYFAKSKGHGRYYDYALTPIENEYIRGKMKKNAMWNGNEINTYEVPSILKYKNQNSEGVDTGSIFINGDAWVEFMGYFLSEGCTTNEINGVKYHTIITQNDGVKADKIKACLDRTPFKYSRIGKDFIINSKQLSEHLRIFGKCHDKFVPKYIKNTTSRQLQIFVDALVLGDGTIKNKYGGIEYISASKSLIDDVSECLLKMGWSGNVRIQRKKGEVVKVPDGRTSTLTENVYSIGFIKPKLCTPEINSRGRNQIEKTDYNGRIYCVEVPNHVIYVRRNGVPVWCGNCSVNKAGITATLMARCSILAMMNPKNNRYDTTLSMASQVDLPPSLLSRFDLMFAITDLPNQEKDRNISAAVFNGREGTRDNVKYTKEEMTKYIIYARSKVREMHIVPEAREMMTDRYLELRGLSKETIVVTHRQLEGMARLAEAHAKMRLSSEVEEIDAMAAIRILNHYLKTMCIDERGNISVGQATGEKTKSEKDRAIFILNKLHVIAATDFWSKKDYSIDELYAACEETDMVKFKKTIEALAKDGFLHYFSDKKINIHR